jgi:hypothetical protein
LRNYHEFRDKKKDVVETPTSFIGIDTDEQYTNKKAAGIGALRPWLISYVKLSGNRRTTTRQGDTGPRIGGMDHDYYKVHQWISFPIVAVTCASEYFSIR